MRPSKAHVQLAGSLAAIAVLSACAQQPRYSAQQEVIDLPEPRRAQLHAAWPGG